MTYAHQAATVTAALVFGAALVACPGSSTTADCPRIAGCQESACCDASRACTVDICQGVSWTCRSSGGGFAWQQGDSTAQCSPPADLGPPPPDGAPSGDTSVDSTSDVSAHDMSPPTPDSTADGPKPQGTACAQAGVSFQVAPALVKCTNVTLTISASTGYTWVLGGIDSPSGGIVWRGNASISGSFTWTFSNVQVPCNDGPFTLKLMKDAVNDDPGQGSVVASCVP